jgi:hypothetical protein
MILQETQNGQPREELTLPQKKPMPSLSMDAHSLFQKPMKARYAMTLNDFATSMSFTGATKANGLHLLMELPRKTVRYDLSQTFAN